MENKPAYLEALDIVTEVAKVGIQETDLIILGEKVLLSPLTGDEEQVLKSGNVSLNTFIKQFNKILFSKIENREETSFTDYETFLKLLTPQDKAMLIFALSLSSFQNLGVVGAKCNKCETEYPAEIIPEQLWHPDSVPTQWDKVDSEGNIINPFEYSEIQEFLDGKLQFELCLPTEFNRIKIMDLMEKNGSQNPEVDDAGIFKVIDTISFFTKRIIIKKGKKSTVLEDLETEIYPFLHNLPGKVKDIIFDEIDLTLFDKYMPKLYQESRCSKCGTINKLDVNIERDFFRKALLSF